MRKYFNTPTIKVYNPMITWYRCGQSTFSSYNHVGIQRKAKIYKSTIERKNQTIRIKADKNPKNEKIVLILQKSRCTIPWSHDTGVYNQHSHHVITSAYSEKQKWTKAPQDDRTKGSDQSGQNPQKWENILILQQSWYTIPWSPDTSVDNQHSRHAMTWVYREKQKWTKAP